MTINCNAINTVPPFSITNGGTGATNAAAAFTALAPAGSAVGDMMYWNGTAWAKLDAPTVAVAKVLTAAVAGGVCSLSWAGT